MKKLYLIRHAHTRDNELKKYSGLSDTELSETGKKQASQLCDYLKEKVKVDKVYTSSLRRTLDTVKEYVDYLNIDVTKMDGLNEMDFGKFDSLTLEEIQKNYPTEYEEFMKGDILFRFPGGENLEDTYERNIKAFEQIMKENDGEESIMIAGHMGTVRNIVSYLLCNSYKVHWHIKIENATVTVFEMHDDFGILSQLGYIPYEDSLLRPHKTKKLRKG